MKSTRIALVVVLFLGSATAASAAMVRHAGEWRTTIDGGQPLLACAQHDEVFDKDSVARAMARSPNAKCTTVNLVNIGPITTFSVQCVVNGMRMTSTGTVTQTGLDAYATKSHLHVEGGAMKLPNGQSFAMPDQDLTSTSRRTGACKPGDRLMNN